MVLGHRHLLLVFGICIHATLICSQDSPTPPCNGLLGPCENKVNFKLVGYTSSTQYAQAPAAGGSSVCSIDGPRDCDRSERIPDGMYLNWKINGEWLPERILWFSGAANGEMNLGLDVIFTADEIPEQVNISAASWDTNAWGYWKLEFVVECAMVVLEEPAPEFAPPNVSTFGSEGVAHWESTRERDRLETSRKLGVNVDSEFWDWHNWWLGDGDRDGRMWNVYNVSVATCAPTVSPTAPTSSPTKAPTVSPTTRAPTVSPTRPPTASPTTRAPTVSPTISPTTKSPTKAPTNSPTITPTKAPTAPPTAAPTASPTSAAPSTAPSQAPTFAPTISPTATDAPTEATYFTLYAQTSTAKKSNSRDANLQVQFFLNGEWTAPQPYFDGGAGASETKERPFALTGWPERARLVADPEMDNWGFWKVWVTHPECASQELILAESPNGIEATVAGGNKADKDWEQWWMGASASETIELDVPFFPSCAPTQAPTHASVLELYAHTMDESLEFGQGASIPEKVTILVQFEIEGLNNNGDNWTNPMPWFSGSHSDETIMNEFTLAKWPKNVRITAEDPEKNRDDAWGFDKVWLGHCGLVLWEDDDNPPEGYWIGKNSPASVTYSVPPFSESCAPTASPHPQLTFELYSATSLQAGAGTSGSPIQVSFQDDDGTWSEPQLYYDPENDEGLNPGGEFAKNFTMPSIPRGVRFITQDNINSWGYWKVWIPRECPIVYAEDLNGAAGSPNTAGSPFWLPNSGVTPAGAVVEHDHVIGIDYTCSPTSAPTPAIVVRVYSHTLDENFAKGAASKDPVYVWFQLPGSADWVRMDEPMFESSSSNLDIGSPSYTVPAWPTRIKVGALDGSSSDPWGFDELWLEHCGLMLGEGERWAGKKYAPSYEYDMPPWTPTCMPTMSPTAATRFSLFSATTLDSDAGSRNAEVMVDFHVGGEWTGPVTYLADRINPGETRFENFTASGLPDRVRLTVASNMNDWGFWKLWIPWTCGDIILAEDQVYGEVGTPPGTAGMERFWMGKSASTSLTFDIGMDPCAPTMAPTSATTIKLSAMTSIMDGMQTSETVNAEWYVNGAWTKDPQDFFDGAKAGETKTRTFTVAARPDRVRVEMDPATDSWGYNKMWVTDGCSVVLYESSMPYILVGKPSFVEYTIDWSQCGSVQVDLRANTMHVPKAGTSDEVKVQFYVNNAWTSAMHFVPSAKPGESIGQVFNLEAYPTQARLVAMNPDQDTWGYTKLWIQDTCEIVLVEDKYGEWIGNKAAPERTYPVRDPDCSKADTDSDEEDDGSKHRFNLLCQTSQSTTFADSNVEVEFYAEGLWQPHTVLLVDGGNAGDLFNRSVALDYWPEQVRITSTIQGGGYAFTHLWIEEDCPITIRTAPEPGELLTWPANENSPSFHSKEFDVPPETACDVTSPPPAAVLVELSAITDTDPLAATMDPVSVRFKVAGVWTEPMLWFDDGAKPGQTKSSTFLLPGHPEEVMLVMDSDADTYGFTKLWITEECDIILVEDMNGEYIGSKAPAERSYDVGKAKCPDINSPALGVPVELNAITASDPKGATVANVTAQFKVDGEWSAPMVFINNGAIANSTKSKTFNLAELPTEVMLSMDPTADTWGFTKLWISADCEIVLSEDDYGEYIGNETAAMRSYVVDLSVCYSPPSSGVVLQLSATTLVNPSRDPGTTGAVQVEFFVNGMWSTPEEFIEGSTPGETDAKVVNLPSFPTQVRLQCSTPTTNNTDDWAFTKLWISAKCDIVLVEDDEGEWMCGADLAGTRVYDVDPSACANGGAGAGGSGATSPPGVTMPPPLAGWDGTSPTIFSSTSVTIYMTIANSSEAITKTDTWYELFINGKWISFDNVDVSSVSTPIPATSSTAGSTFSFTMNDLPGFPTKVRPRKLSTDQDSLGYSKLWIDVAPCVIVLAEDMNGEFIGGRAPYRRTYDVGQPTCPEGSLPSGPVGSSPTAGYPIEVTSVTSDGSNAGTNGNVTISFEVGGDWGPDYPLITGPNEPGQETKETFVIPGRPDKVKITGDTLDSWGPQRLTITAECTVILIEDKNGEYIGGPYAPTERIYLVDWSDCPQVGRSASPTTGVVIDLRVLTADGANAGTSGPIEVEFLVQDEWTQPLDFFPGGSDPGQQKSHAFTVSQWPEQVRVCAGMEADSFGFKKLWISADCDIVLSRDKNGEYIGEFAPKCRTYDIDYSNCNPDAAPTAGVSIELKATAAGAENAASDGPIHLSFYEPSVGWTDPVSFVSGGFDALQTRGNTFTVPAYPTRVRIQIPPGGDSFGYTKFWMPFGDCEIILSADSNGEYIGEFAPDERIYQVDWSQCSPYGSPSEPTVLQLSVRALDHPMAGTPDAISAKFYADGEWSAALDFLPQGINASATDSKEFTLGGFPETVMLTIDATADPFCFTKLWISDECSLVLKEDLQGECMGGPDFPAQRSYTTKDLVCEASGTVFKMLATTGTSDDASTIADVVAQFYVGGQWGAFEPFFSGSASGATESNTFTSEELPTRARLIINSTADSWGFTKLWIEDDCEIILSEDVHGEWMGLNLPAQREYDVDLALCSPPAPVSLTVNALTGSKKSAASNGEIMVAFRVNGEADGEPAVFFADGAVQGQLKTKQFVLPEFPDQMTIMGDPGDVYGFDKLWLDDGCELVLHPTPSKSDTQFVGGNQDSQVSYDVKRGVCPSAGPTPAGEVAVILHATTGMEDTAATTAPYDVVFCFADGSCTDAVKYLNSPVNSTQSVHKLFNLQDYPTLVKMKVPAGTTAATDDMWGYDHLWISVGDCDYELYSGPSTYNMGMYDQNNKNAYMGVTEKSYPVSITLPCPGAPTAAAQAIELWATTAADPSSSSTAQINVEWKIYDLWSTVRVFSTGPKLTGGHVNKTFMLADKPSQVRVSTQSPDDPNWGYEKLWIPRPDCDIVLIEDKNGEFIGQYAAPFRVYNIDWSQCPDAFAPTAVATPTPAPANTVTLELYSRTDDNPNAATNMNVAVAFEVNGQWLDPQNFFSGAAVNETKSKSFSLPARPTHLKLSAEATSSPLDSYGFDKMWIVDECVIIVHEDQNGEYIGDMPSSRTYFIDYSKCNYAPTIDNTPKPVPDWFDGNLMLNAHTQDDSDAESITGVFHVQWYINGQWLGSKSSPSMFPLEFVETGDALRNSTTSKSYELSNVPTMVRLVDGNAETGSDSWGFDHLYITMGACRFDLYGPAEEALYMGDSNAISMDFAVSLFRCVDSPPAPPSTWTLFAATSSHKHAKTTGQVFVDFDMIGTGDWKEYEYFNGASRSEVLSKTFSTPSLPARIRIRAERPTMNAWGFWRIWIDDGCVLVLIEHPDGEVGVHHISDGGGPNWMDFWLGDDARPHHTFDVGSAGSCAPTSAPTRATSITLYAATSTAANSKTSSEFFVQFMINGNWTNPKSFFDGASSGSIRSKQFSLPGEPTAVKISTDPNSNAWGFWKIWLENGCEFVLAEHPDGEQGVDHMNNGGGANWQSYWLGTDGAPASVTYTIDTTQSCSPTASPTAATRFTLYVSTSDASNSQSPGGKFYVQFMVSGEWTENTLFVKSPSSGSTASMDFTLSALPSLAILSAERSRTNAWGIWKVWLEHFDEATQFDCQRVLLEDPNGAAGHNHANNGADPNWEQYWIGDGALPSLTFFVSQDKDVCTQDHQGYAYDGYLGNCQMTFEHPTNATVHTNADGTFTITGPQDAIQNAVLVLTPDLDGCGDTATNTSLAITLKAPPMATAISPMSTLLVYVMQVGKLTESEADAKIKEALAMPDLGGSLHATDAIATVHNSNFEDANAAMHMLNRLAKVHNFVLATAVMISGQWAVKAETQEEKEAQFAEHLRAGDLAMLELATEITLLPAGGVLDLTDPELLVDIMKRAHVKHDDSNDPEAIHQEATAVAASLQIVSAAMDAITESHGPDTTPAELMELFDVFSSVSQTHLPEQVGELISGKITKEQFAKLTTHEALEDQFDGRCSRLSCRTKYPEAVSEKRKKKDDTAGLGVGGIFGVVVAVLVVLSAAGAFLYYRNKSRSTDLDVEDGKGPYANQPYAKDSQFSADRAPAVAQEQPMCMVSALSDLSASYTEAPHAQLSDVVFEDTVTRRAVAVEKVPLASFPPTAKPLVPGSAYLSKENAYEPPGQATRDEAVDAESALSNKASSDLAEVPNAQDARSLYRPVQPHTQVESPAQLLTEVKSLSRASEETAFVPPDLCATVGLTHAKPAVSSTSNLDIAEVPTVHDVHVANTQDHSPKQPVQPHLWDDSPAQMLTKEQADPLEGPCSVPSSLPIMDKDGLLLAQSGACPIRFEPAALPEEISSDKIWSTPALEFGSLDVATAAVPSQHLSNDEGSAVKCVGAASDVASTYSTGKLSTDAASTTSDSFESAVEDI